MDQELLHGQLDVDLDGTGVGVTAQSQILANPTLKAQADDGYTNALTYMTINTTIKPFDNLSCRQAVEYAVDKTTVQSALGGAIGGGDIASTLRTPHMAGIHAGGGSTNLGEYDSQQVDSFFTQYLSTTDQATRNKISTEIDQQAMSEAAIVPLVYNKALIYHPANVTNWYMQPAFGEPDF